MSVTTKLIFLTSTHSKQLVDVVVTVVSHEEDVHFSQILTGDAPVQLRVGGPGEDEAVQYYFGIPQPSFHFFDALQEADLHKLISYVQSSNDFASDSNQRGAFRCPLQPFFQRFHQAVAFLGRFILNRKHSFPQPAFFAFEAGNVLLQPVLF